MEVGIYVYEDEKNKVEVIFKILVFTILSLTFLFPSFLPFAITSDLF